MSGRWAFQQGVKRIKEAIDGDELGKQLVHHPGVDDHAPPIGGGQTEQRLIGSEFAVGVRKENLAHESPAPRGRENRVDRRDKFAIEKSQMRSAQWDGGRGYSPARGP